MITDAASGVRFLFSGTLPMSSERLLAHADLLRSGTPTFTGWVSTASPVNADLLAREDFDSITLDMQHGLHDPVSVMRAIGSVSAAGVPVIVRVPVGDFAMAARALDVGAVGVIAPMIDTAADARAFVAQVKYPPVGRRSWGAGTAMALHGVETPLDYLHGANDATLALAMIETREAVEAIDEILAVEGLDGVFIGPNDLSIALTDGERIDVLDPLVDGALDRIAAAARDEVRPIDDVRATAWYRKELVFNMTRRMLGDVAQA